MSEYLRGLDPTWLCEALASSELPGADTLAGAEFEGFIGTGQMSRNARFSLQWPADAEGPSSVVVKVPSGDEATTAWSIDSGLYEKECYFYSHISPLVDVSVPRIWVNSYDGEARDFALVMEDLVESEQGDQFSEPTGGELRLAIAQAAALHSPTWGAVDVPELAPLVEAATERAPLLGAYVEQCLPVCLDRLGGGLGPAIVELVNQFGPLVTQWASGHQAPPTVGHADFRPDNFLFGQTTDAPPLVVVDWQTYFVGPGVNDVSYLLGGALASETRRRVEADCLDHYVAELAGRGVSYDRADCERDYGRGSLHGLVIAITATARAAQTERGDALFTLMLERHGQHALDTDALSLI